MRNTQTPRTDAAETNWWSEDGLRSAFIVRADFARELEREMNQLRKERDEARRIACENEARHNSIMFDNPMWSHPPAIAESRGWDCFKQEFFVGDDDHAKEGL